jgi:carbon monoxide dehydrogenase subunit G
MKITQSFTVARPVPMVWDFFQDIPAVTGCLPGAELIESRADGTHRGKVAVALGPFKAAFEGEAQIVLDAPNRSGHVVGRGVDKRGGSHSKLTLDYRLHDEGGATRVDIDADLVLSGPVAQFGRTGLVIQTVNLLIGDFVRNLEARLAPTSSASGAARPAPAVAPGPRSLNGVALIAAVLRAWILSLVRRRQAHG